VPWLMERSVECPLCKRVAIEVPAGFGSAGGGGAVLDPGANVRGEPQHQGGEAANGNENTLMNELRTLYAENMRVAGLLLGD
jgi:hypothetical protein